MTDTAFSLGEEGGLLAGTRGALCDGFDDVHYWQLTVDSHYFAGSWETALFEADIERFAEELLQVIDQKTRDWAVELGEDRGRVAQIEIHWGDDKPHAFVTVTPHGSDPMPSLEYEMPVDPDAWRRTVLGLLGRTEP
ncbi:hypothetical protein GCM10022225_78630 [Plantactinospora mayteni]|uniref:Uncharacterized protein n=1 Tax=Plantactinospora mayteni TaxID=566021 RepID=A0ABQ4F323_9ACTN|nr:hypothetical protein [Plantactinospora mayteni]GIH01287.1 hypothetical protein Pma05_78590 [Plantactinospora mayteni]